MNRRDRNNTRRVPSPAATTDAPSTVVHHLDALMADGRRVIAIPYMRVSSTEQRTGGNLRTRAGWLHRNLLQREGVVVNAPPIEETLCGRYLDHRRTGLLDAIAKARVVQQANPRALVVVVTDARNRFVRGAGYNGRHYSDEVSGNQFHELMQAANGITLATVLHPAAPFSEVRSHETMLTKKKVGRPVTAYNPSAISKAEDKAYPMEEAWRLHCDGLTKREIGRRLGVDDRTVRRWLEQTRRELARDAKWARAARRLSA